MIYFYFLSVVIYFYSIFKSKQNILSPFVFFGVFSFIYSFFPWLYLNSEVEMINLSWEDLNTKSANTILLLQTLSNFFLCLIMFLPASRNLISIINDKESISRINLKSIYWFVYPISLALSWLFPWPQFGEDLSIGNTVAAFFKSILLITFCVYCGSSNSIKKFIAFVPFLFLCIIDTSRTTLLLLIFLYAYYNNMSWKKLFRYLPFVIVLFSLFLWISLNRSGIDFEPKYISWVFYVESIFGSYSTFQSIMIVENNLVPLNSFLYPIVDILISLVPSVFFDILGLIKSNSFLTTNFLTSLFENGFISEKYAPMGGHFYLAEFFLYFHFCAPFFVALYYYLFIKLLKKIRYKEIALMLYCSSFLLVKAPILNNFKFFFSILILSYVLLFFFKLIKRKTI